MVDISAKSASERIAKAIARVRMQAQTLDAIFGGGVAKGDVLAVARVAGIQGAKRTSDLIPLCHPLSLAKVTVEFERHAADVLQIATECKVTGQTGVEMEALTAATVAALTVYDMCKSADRSMSIESVQLIHKSGGKSGDWDRPGSD